MSEQDWTEEPWHTKDVFGFGYLFDKDGHRIAITSAVYEEAEVVETNPDTGLVTRQYSWPSLPALANARRIVACVNALADVYDPETYVARLLARIAELEAPLETAPPLGLRGAL